MIHTYTDEQLGQLLNMMYQKGIISALETALDSMAEADCGCNYLDAIDFIHEAMHEEIDFYERHFGPYVTNLQPEADDVI